MLYTNYEPTPVPKHRQELVGPPDQLMYDLSSGYVFKYNIQQPTKANALNTGVVRALVSEPKSNYEKFPNLAVALGAFKSGYFVAYQGSTRVATNIATTPSGGSGTAGTITDGSDSDGSNKQELATASGTYFQRNVTTFNVPYWPPFGVYMLSVFKFPTTANQTNLVDRVFRFGMYSTLPSGGNDPAGQYLEIILHEDSFGGNFMLRTKDGTTSSRVDTGVSAALDTLYVAELWTPNGTTYYARINGVTVSKTSNVPVGGAVAFSVLEYLCGMITDQGDTVLKSYRGCALSVQ